MKKEIFLEDESYDLETVQHFLCHICKNPISKDLTKHAYNPFEHENMSTFEHEEEMACSNCGTKYKIKANIGIEVEINYYVEEVNIYMLDDNTDSEEMIKLIPLCVGDAVDLEDGIYKGNLYEYHVKNNTLMHKYNILTDTKQLTLDLVFDGQMELNI